MKGSWEVVLDNTQGNSLPWPEEIAFDVYQYPGHNNWKEEYFHERDDDWYLVGGQWDSICIHSIANWEYYNWDYENEEWDFIDFGHLEELDYKEFWVLKSRSRLSGIFSFLELIQKVSFFIKLLSLFK